MTDPHLDHERLHEGACCKSQGDKAQCVRRRYTHPVHAERVHRTTGRCRCCLLRRPLLHAGKRVALGTHRAPSGKQVLPNRLRENELFVKPELYAPPARSGGVRAARASEFSLLDRSYTLSFTSSRNLFGCRPSRCSWLPLWCPRLHCACSLQLPVLSCVRTARRP